MQLALGLPGSGGKVGGHRPHPGDTSISLLASPLDSELLRAHVGRALGSHHYVACWGTGSPGLLLSGGSMVAAWASSRLFPRFRRVGRAPGSPSESSLFAQPPPAPTRLCSPSGQEALLPGVACPPGKLGTR